MKSSSVLYVSGALSHDSLLSYINSFNNIPFIVSDNSNLWHLELCKDSKLCCVVYVFHSFVLALARTCSLIPLSVIGSICGRKEARPAGG